jgi:hypothetical protein
VTNISVPMLAPAPGTTPGPGANTGHPFTSPSARYPDLTASVLQRAGKGYDAWLGHVWPAAACSHPIRLHGLIRHVDPATGEIVRTASTDHMPDRVIYKPCGNRRDRACSGCAETYRRDAFQLIRAGLAGGKGVPATVAAHPAVFATFTAPSFGPIHARPVRHHTCASRDQCRCKPEPCHARRDAGTCPHGRPWLASGGIPRTTPGSASRYARTATTTPPTSSGTPAPGNCGGAPSKTSNAI